MDSTEYKRERGKFASTGVGLKSGAKNISAKFPQPITEVLDRLDNKAAYVRNAVIKQLKQDGYID